MRRPFADRRAALGLSVERAAARLGISPGYLRTLERGGAPLSDRVAGKMAVLYATTLHALTQIKEPSGQLLPFQEQRRKRRARRTV